jgi:hypothetical protein
MPHFVASSIDLSGAANDVDVVLGVTLAGPNNALHAKRGKAPRAHERER